jgi:hypothetical protein
MSRAVSREREVSCPGEFALTLRLVGASVIDITITGPGYESSRQDFARRTVANRL